MIPRLAAIAVAALLVSGPPPAQAQTLPSGRDRHARIIARADAVILGRVLEAGLRGVPDPAPNNDIVTQQGFARIEVQHWIIGPDTNPTVQVRLSPYDAELVRLRQAASQSDRRVILYLVRSRGEWWLVRETAHIPDNPAAGIEILSTSEALNRMPAILREGARSSLDSLAAQADLAVVASLDQFIDDPPRMKCRINRVVFGTLTDTVLTVVQPTPADLRRGTALLLLTARPDSTWELLDNGASCFYLDLDRVARMSAPLEAVLGRAAAIHSSREGGSDR